MRGLVIIACLFAVGLSEKVSYEGYQVIKVNPAAEGGKALLDFLAKSPKVIMGQDIIDDETPVTVAVPPEIIARFSFMAHKSQYTVEVPNLGSTLKKEQARVTARSGYFNLHDFNQLHTIDGELRIWQQGCSQKGLSCDYRSIGQSSEGRDIMEFKISTGPGKQAVWLDSAIHPREWLSPATNLKILNHMLDSYQTDRTVRNFLDSYDWYFVIIVNPDGYVYTWTKDRYWRKNTRRIDPYSPPHCIGADLNRNFAYQWGADGVISWDPCEETYVGDSPGSEPETQVLQNRFVELQQRQGVLTMLTIHAFGNYWLFPFGHRRGGSCEHARNHDDMTQVSEAVAVAIENTYGTSWKRGSSCEAIYPNSGSSMDYAMEIAGISHPYAAEVRGTWFDVSPSEIQKSFEEMWNGVVAWIQAVERLG